MFTLAPRLAERLATSPAASRGLDGITYAPLVSFADRLSGNHKGRQTLSAFIDPFHAVHQSRSV